MCPVCVCLVYLHTRLICPHIIMYVYSVVSIPRYARLVSSHTLRGVLGMSIHCVKDMCMIQGVSKYINGVGRRVQSVSV